MASAFEKAATPDTGCVETWTFKINGEGNGASCDVKVNFVISGQKAYRFEFWAGGGSNKLDAVGAANAWSGRMNFCVKDLGTNTWLGENDLYALFGSQGVDAPVTLTFNGKTYTPTVYEVKAKGAETIPGGDYFARLQLKDTDLQELVTDGTALTCTYTDGVKTSGAATFSIASSTLDIVTINGMIVVAAK